MLKDSYGRRITDLRVGVTDRCNFRCIYCRAAEPENYEPPEHLLTWPELLRLCTILGRLGLRKIRVTGGEPLGRAGGEEFVARLSALGLYGEGGHAQSRGAQPRERQPRFAPRRALRRHHPHPRGAPAGAGRD